MHTLPRRSSIATKRFSGSTQRQHAAQQAGTRPARHRMPTLPALPAAAAGPHNFAAYKLECFVECWTKLRMWELGQYDRWGGCVNGAR